MRKYWLFIIGLTTLVIVSRIDKFVEKRKKKQDKIYNRAEIPKENNDSCYVVK